MSSPTVRLPRTHEANNERSQTEWLTKSGFDFWIALLGPDSAVSFKLRTTEAEPFPIGSQQSAHADSAASTLHVPLCRTDALSPY
jgi:hypothetical protein